MLKFLIKKYAIFQVEGRRGVTTTVVCPYYVSTGMFEGVKSR